MMISLPALNDGVIPVGSPVDVPIPVAPGVDMVISVIAEFKHTVGEEDGVPAESVSYTHLTLPTILRV